MDFSFSEEQLLLRDSVEKFIRNDYDFEARRRIISSDNGFSRNNWQLFAELGWLALPFSEEHGGIGGTPVDTMILLEQFGKALVVEPYIPTVVLGGGFIAKAGSTEQQQQLLPGIIDGSLQFAFAYAEAQSRYNLADINTRAQRTASGYRLDGHKSIVINAPAADKLIVAARTAGGRQDEQGITLVLVDTAAAGVSLRSYPTVDGLRAAEVTFDNVKLDTAAMLGELDNALPLIENVTDAAIVALGAEAVGAMEVLYKTTVDFCKAREQFGQPIGQFQVLQHRMVDMFMEYEQSRSLLYMAVLKLDSATAGRKKAVSALKIRIGEAGRFIGQQAVQLHGGMGMTDELPVGHYFKRLSMINTMFGNADHHLNRFAAL
jgi:pimeloyl-CoA dehydrogenase small subunit